MVLKLTRRVEHAKAAVLFFYIVEIELPGLRREFLDNAADLLWLMWNVANPLVCSAS